MATVGKYTLIRKLATGGMAEVFLARAEGPMGFQKRLVVKRILPHFSDDPQFVQMFLGEARLAAELNHPNLVQIFDFGEADGQYFIAMEYIEGPNLRILNKAARESFGPVPLPIAARIIALAAEGLHHAHELRDEAGRPVQLVHRDISPDNILVSRTGSVKVVDFGIAKAANQPHLTKSGMIKGKMAYMPPEQLAREPLDRRVDVFALGVVLYELVCGAMPFDATSEVSIIQAIMGQAPLGRVRERRPDVPKKLDDIIAKCLEKSPANRYATARDLQLELERFIQSTGDVVGTADLSALIEKLFPSDWEATNPSTKAEVDDALGPTAQRKSTKEAEAPAAKTAPGEPTGLSSTALRDVQPRRSPLHAAIGAVAVAIIAIGAWLALRPAKTIEPVAPKSVVDAGAVAAAAERDAAIETVPDAAVAVAIEPVDAGAIAELVADAGVKAPAPVRPGKLELRVRPYAVVFIDGRELGSTPLPPQSLPAGRHKLRLVNKDLGKDVALEVVIKSGDTTVLKHNLKE